MVSWMTGARIMEDGSTDDGDADNHTAVQQRGLCRAYRLLLKFNRQDRLLEHWLTYIWMYVSAHGCVHVIGAKSVRRSAAGPLTMTTDRSNTATGGERVAVARISAPVCRGQLPSAGANAALSTVAKYHPSHAATNNMVVSNDSKD